SEKAKWEITKFVKGKRVAKYHLRDWLISRQRYWGPPIPIIYCDKCGIVPVAEKDLPVLLPNVKNFRPTGTDKSPLASVAKFVNTKCPKCKSPARRETDVSDTFLDSAWYFFRYPSTRSARSGQVPFDPTLTRKWLPVDMYIGGQEHAVLHLLYARFITMALKDGRYVEFDEPFKKFRAHGLLIKDGKKMSKSKGNVVNPDEIFKKYGADTTRLYLMFLGPFTEGGDWSDKNIIGIYRFLNRIWSLCARLSLAQKGKPDFNVETLRQRTIKKVTEDLENLRYNTAIAALMEYSNALQQLSNVTIEQLKTLLILLAPFAPYITEELWHELGHKESIHNQRWPKYDAKKIQQEEIRLILQVNGKVRDVIEVEQGISESDAKQVAFKNEKIQKWLQGKEPKKIIFVPDRLINVVI
ncbi:MAG: class I tRNA ligase family protein, partial [Patescibacteria group bacterium]